MSAYLSPIFNEPQVDANGNPLSGGTITTYAAGSTTPATTYTSSAGTVPQANPIVLNSRGVPDSPIWLAGGTSYKFVLQDANGITLAPTLDGVQGINDPSGTTIQDQFLTLSATPTFLSATSFSVPGDQTGTLQAGRRLKSTNSGGTVVSTILSATFSTVTTVSLLNDGGVSLDSGLSTVSYGLLSATSSSAPQIKYPTPNNRVINGACLVAQYGSKAISNGAVVYGGCDRIGVTVTATTVSGTLAQANPAVTGIGSFGKVQRANITTTGNGTVQFFTRLEGKHVRDMGGQSVIVAAKVYQNSGNTIVFTPSIYKATALDNFTGLTLLLTGPATAVQSGVATTVFMQGSIAAGDADNGLQVVIASASFSPVTGINFDISDVYFATGATVLEYQMGPQDITEETLKCKRYGRLAPPVAMGFAATTTAGLFTWSFAEEMRAVPTFTPLTSTSSLAVGSSTTAIGGTWASSVLGVKGVSAVFTRSAGTFTTGDGLALNDSNPPFFLNAEL